MALIQSVEKPQYINNLIDIYSKNKVGQYSKFLTSAPTFVTYYHINQPLSRQDVGTGSIESELGERSPIRFNKILNFPIYNVPDLKPDVVYDENGYDIELDCNDLVILPNTIKPRSGDYFIIAFPGYREYLFRVNNFQYNTIQSNDFYRIDADVKDIGVNLEDKRMFGQIVETYLTVFENIGTEDRCFLKSSDTEYINSLADLFFKLREFYKNAFYINDLNTFTFQTGKWSETGRPIYRYDPFLETFINKSNIYYDQNSEESLVLTPAHVLSTDFNFNFDFTLYKALLDKNLELLRPYCYITTEIITSVNSVFNMMGYFGECVDLHCFKAALDKSSVTPCPCSGNGSVVVSTSGQEEWYDLNPLPNCTPTWTLANGIEYFNSDFLKMILNGNIDTDDYCELLIFNYLHGISTTIDRKEIMSHIDKDEHTYYFLPMVIYIISTIYRGYFVSEKEIEV